MDRLTGKHYGAEDYYMTCSEKCGGGAGGAGRWCRMSEWISVKDRLPDTSADILVAAYWHDSWQTMVGWYSGNYWWVYTSHGAFMPGPVSHWMPLPEPPKEGTT